MEDCVDSIDRLYKNYDILSSAGENILEHEAKYKEILDAVKGTPKEKRLASQFIGKFFKCFPHLADTAIDALIDLCEDDDVQIRRQAIKELPSLCKSSKKHTAAIADILAQLLSAVDVIEMQQVTMSLIALAKLEPTETLNGLFTQIRTSDSSRERCFKFLLSKFRGLGPEIITNEVEDYLIAQIKKILVDVTDDEFGICMTVLAGTKLSQSVSGQSELVQIVIEQTNAALEPDTNISDLVQVFIKCAEHAVTYFSSQVESTKFVIFLTERIFNENIWKQIRESANVEHTASKATNEQLILRLLQILAECCTYCGQLDESSANACVTAIFGVLVDYMPLPPLDSALDDVHPSFQYSHAECLLYALHSMGKQIPAFFSDDAARLKEFRTRLQYLARGAQGCIKRLQEALRGKNKEELNSDENKLKVTALKTTSNINTLIRDLFHSPPTFKSSVQLSWKRSSERPSSTSTAGIAKQGTKRYSSGKNGPENAGDEAKRAKNGGLGNNGHKNDQRSIGIAGQYSKKTPGNYTNGGGRKQPQQQQRRSGGGGVGPNNNRRKR